MEKLNVLKYGVLLVVCLFLTGCDINIVITAPQNGARFESGETITFYGTAADPIEGEIPEYFLIWTSSIDGEIGTGTAFTRDDLSEGTHIIVLAATNAAGKTKRQVVSITITQGEEDDNDDDIERTEMNFFNNLLLNGRKFTARLECSSITYESYTGKLSDCKPVEDEFCDCKLYADGIYKGYFRGCVDIRDYCYDDATLILTLSGSNPALAYKCVDECGDPITAGSDLLDYEHIMELTSDVEDSQESLDLYLDY